MRKMLRYLENYKKECILAPLFKMLEASFELFVPYVVAYIIDKGIGESSKNNIVGGCLILVVLALVGLACAVCAQYFAAKAAVGFSCGLKSDLYSHLLKFSNKQIDSIGTSTMINRITGDVNLAQNGVNMFLRLFLRSPFVVFGAMIMAFTIDSQIAMIFVAVIIILFLIVGIIMRINIPILKNVQDRLDELLSDIRQNLSGARVIRAFTLEDEEIEKFTDSNKLMSGKKNISGIVSSFMNPVTYVFINIAIILVIYTGGIKVSAGALSTGNVVALYNYMSQILVELVKLANLVVTLNRALASSRRISEVFDINPNEAEDINDGIKDDSRDFIEFDNVSLRYHSNSDDVLSGISFKIKRGQTIGIIGATGSGKSSLAALIPNLYNATQGRIFVDGRDVCECNRKSLRKKISFAMQKSVMFKGTVLDNMTLGDKSITVESVMNALDKSCALDFVMDKGGIESEVSEGGANFSGGQKQRLSVARALATNPEILILDDVTSALDYSTERKLLNNISQLDEDITTLIISQRASSVMAADKILVLDDGKMVAFDTHANLLNNCSIYQEIYRTQFS